MKEQIIDTALRFDTRKDIFWGAVAIMGICACMYVYFATTTVRNIVMTKQLSLQTSNIDQKVSSKEFALISMKNNLTIAYAELLGFTEAKQKVFITPTSVSYVSTNSSSNTI